MRLKLEYVAAIADEALEAAAVLEAIMPILIDAADKDKELSGYVNMAYKALVMLNAREFRRDLPKKISARVRNRRHYDKVAYRGDLGPDVLAALEQARAVGRRSYYRTAGDGGDSKPLPRNADFDAAEAEVQRLLAEVDAEAPDSIDPPPPPPTVTRIDNYEPVEGTRLELTKE